MVNSHKKYNRFRIPIFVENSNRLCSYGCGRVANYYFDCSKSWCCESSHNKCSENIKKNRIKHLGKKASDKVVKIFRDSNERRKTDPEFKKKLSLLGKQLVGDKNPNWKGGTSTFPYCGIFTEGFKKRIKERDNFICQNLNCKRTTIVLAVHHIDYDKWRCDDKNLITICVSCNSIANGNREFWKNFYLDIIKKKYRELEKKPED